MAAAPPTMSPSDPVSPLKRLRQFWIGKAIDPSAPGTFHSISLAAFFAWVGLGSDGLSSSAYGPEEAFLALGHHAHLAIFVAIASALTVLIISASYMQIIEAFPAGGGGYLVASKLLSPFWGMVSGCALLIDYVLTITISVASAADAVFSFLPLEWQAHKLPFTYAILGLLIILNLRGTKESVLPLVPVFLIFIFTHAFAVLHTLITHLFGIGAVAAEALSDAHATRSELGLWGMVFLVMRAYSMGAGTYTGIEAVSNGLPILREPRVRTGKRTMVYMSASLAFMVFGLILAYLLYHLKTEPGKTLNASLLWEMSEHWPHGWGRIFVTVSLASEALILMAAAQAGFLGGPRVLANMAVDRWFPTRFAMLSDRLVTQNGILLMGSAALLTLFLTGGSVKYLVVLYSITVFITFVLSQGAMVKYWWRARKKESRWRRRAAINGIGFTLSAFILVFMTFLKFDQGGWITLAFTAALIGVSLLIRKHYRRVLKAVKRLDTLVKAARLARMQAEKGETSPLLLWEAEVEAPGAKGKDAAGEPVYNPKAKTAVLIVSGFDGLGLHSLFAVLRLFGNLFKNFIFVEVGVLDAGTFKGEEEVERLQTHVDGELAEYVRFMKSHGYHAEAVSILSHDAVDGAATAAPRILERYPQAVFFMGQLVFEEETIFSRLLHNNLVFALQRRLYHQGIPFIILPVRIRMEI
jgi:amino acid transporter